MTDQCVCSEGDNLGPRRDADGQARDCGRGRPPCLSHVSSVQAVGIHVGKAEYFVNSSHVVKTANVNLFLFVWISSSILLSCPEAATIYFSLSATCLLLGILFPLGAD